MATTDEIDIIPEEALEQRAEIKPKNISLVPGRTYTFSVTTSVEVVRNDFLDYPYGTIVDLFKKSAVSGPTVNISVSGAGATPKIVGVVSPPESYNRTEVDLSTTRIRLSAQSFQPESIHRTLVRVRIPEGTDSVTIQAQTGRETSASQTIEASPTQTYSITPSESRWERLAALADARARTLKSLNRTYWNFLGTKSIDEITDQGMQDVFIKSAMAAKKIKGVASPRGAASQFYQYYNSVKSEEKFDGPWVGPIIQATNDMWKTAKIKRNKDEIRKAGNTSERLETLRHLAKEEARAWRNHNRTKAVNKIQEQISLYAPPNTAENLYYAAQAQEIEARQESRKRIETYFTGVKKFALTSRDTLEVIKERSRRPTPSVKLKNKPTVREQLASKGTVQAKFKVSNGGGPTTIYGFLSLTYSNDTLKLKKIKQVDEEPDGEVLRDTVYDPQNKGTYVNDTLTNTYEPGVEKVLTRGGDRKYVDKPVTDIFERFDPGETNTYLVTFERTGPISEPATITYRTAFQPLVHENGQSAFVRDPTSGTSGTSSGVQEWPVFTISAQGTFDQTILSVDNDGQADYKTIQTAIDNADEGDRIVVKPGTYRERLTIQTNVTIVAPKGATLNGSTFSSPSAITIPGGSRVAPVIDGFTIVNYETGVAAGGEPHLTDSVGSSGNWLLKNTTIIDSSFIAVDASQSTGSWMIQNTTIRASKYGVVARDTQGNWEIHNSSIAAQRYAVEATSSAGNWIIHNTITNSGWGIDSEQSDGNWRILNSTISQGLDATYSSGNWTVLSAVLNGTGIDAGKTSGQWDIHQTAFINIESDEVSAYSASPEGNATQNWWGKDGADCVGNVDCSNPLSTRPGENKNSPPIAKIAVSNQTVTTGEAVVLNATASKDADSSVLSYNWSLGDGTTERGVKITQTYSSPGTYTVNLTVTTGDGMTNTTSQTITVLSPPQFTLEEVKTDNSIQGLTNDTNFLGEPLLKDRFVLGNPLEITFQLTNTESYGGSRTVELTVRSGFSGSSVIGQNQTQVYLNASESTQRTLAVPTEAVSGPTYYRATVEISNSSTSKIISGRIVSNNSKFEVNIKDTNRPVEPGESLSVTASIENNRYVSGTQPIILEVPNIGTNSTTLQLDALESKQLTLTIPTQANDVGRYQAKVTSNNTSASIPVNVFNTPEQDIDTSDLPGNGTQSHPYIITNASELQAIEDDLDANYTLAHDINASGTAKWNGGKGFDPIGDGDTPAEQAFRGSFNGNGHTIRGLTINRPNAHYVGLFGLQQVSASRTAETKNVTLSNITIIGEDAVGGIAGYSNAKITKVSVSGSVNGTDDVGGITGYLGYSGEIRKSTAHIHVIGWPGKYGGTGEIGGLVGTIGASGNYAGEVSTSYVRGRVTRGSGLVGYNAGIVNNSYAAAHTTGSGLIGTLADPPSYQVSPSVNDVYWNRNITQSTSKAGTGLTTDQMTGQEARKNMRGLSFGTVWQTRLGDYPVLMWEADGDGVAGSDNGIAPFSDTEGLNSNQLNDNSLSGQIRVETPVANNKQTSVDILRASATNYSIAITAPDSAENVTFYLQTRAISASQNIEGLTMYLDDEQHPFVVNESAGAGKSPWIAFNIPHFSTRTVSFTDSGETLVVDDDGNANYTSIQNAVDNATSGDTVEVRPGTYEEPVDVEKNITLIAPDGATITNTSAVTAEYSTIEAQYGIQLHGPISPIISGFTLTGWQTAFSTGDAEGDWVLRNTMITNSSLGVGASGTSANWTIANVTIHGGTYGVSAYGSSGDWQIRNSSIENSTTGVFASHSSGDWSIRNTLIVSAEDAVSADQTDGAWLINATTLRGNQQAVEAVNTTGSWEIHWSSFRNNSEGGIDATNASIQGNATYNWWSSSSGPDPNDCVGNVTCTPALSSPPETPPFTVTIESTNTPVMEGETLSVTANITNMGSDSGTQTITLENFADEVVASTSISLNASESRTLTIEWQTDENDAGSGNVSIVSATDSATVPVTVEETTADFEVRIKSTNTPVTEGKILSVSANVTNTGNDSGAQAITLSNFTGEQVDSRIVSLTAGESQIVTLEWPTGDSDAGSGTVTVSSVNNSATTTITVKNAVANVTLVNASLSRRVLTTGENVYINATVNNTGQAAGNITLGFYRENDRLLNYNVSVPAGENRTIRIKQPFTTAGTYNLTVKNQSTGGESIPAGTVVVNEPQTETRTGAPGFGFTPALIALLATIFIYRRRH